MKVTIRRAQEKELAAVERIYDAIHTEEEAGRASDGNGRSILPGGRRKTLWCGTICLWRRQRDVS